MCMRYRNSVGTSGTTTVYPVSMGQYPEIGSVPTNHIGNWWSFWMPLLGCTGLYRGSPPWPWICVHPFNLRHGLEVMDVGLMEAGGPWLPTVSSATCAAPVIVIVRERFQGITNGTVTDHYPPYSPKMTCNAYSIRRYLQRFNGACVSYSSIVS